MSYLAVRFDVEAAQADRWSDALLEAGALSVDAADPRAGTLDESAIFGEPADAAPGWWPITRLTALCANECDPALLVRTAARCVEQALPVFETHALPDQDWVRATQAQFEPIRINDNLWIVPTWRDPPRPGAVNIRLDPGLAFGTGAHPTTRLCLAWLAEQVARTDSVLDYGCGSGVLAIAAARLGAACVSGVDIDAQAVRASVDNALANGVHGQFRQVDALAPQTFSIVVANILANPLRVLAPALAARTRAGGRIALSGILASQATEVTDAYARWFATSVWQRDGEWVLVAGTRKAQA
ncbi:MAG TPA: 50S ribosomal protein L11 methyltransferase [Casimicrobiaceae bacterium]|nr:50S ribosomal protein L11 methyltransferase [Casimicrobiaceae bacterium]